MAAFLKEHTGQADKEAKAKRPIRVRGVAGRLGGIAICGALPHLMIPPSRPAGGTRSRISKSPRLRPS